MFTTLQNPKKKADFGEDFLNKYPQSAARSTVLQQMIDAYQAVGDQDGTLSAANRILQEDPNNLKAIYFSVLIEKMQCGKSSGEQACQDAAGLAQRGLTVRKRGNVSEEEWKKLTDLAYPVFHSAIALADANARSDHPDAIRAQARTPLFPPSGYPSKSAVADDSRTSVVESNALAPGIRASISQEAGLKPLSDVDQFILSKRPAPPEQNRWAVIIGVEHYSRAEIPPATYAERDALAMREYFVKLLGVPERHVYLLTGDHATKTRIEELLKIDLPSRIKLTGADADQVFFYYSGHGAPSETGGFLLPFDGDPRPESLAVTAISLNELYDDLSVLGAKSAIAFLDACFTGNTTRAGSAKSLVPGTRTATWNGPAPTVPPTVIALTAASKDQNSNAYDDEKHGLFTYFLLRGMEQKGVDLSALYQKVEIQVEDKAGELFDNALTQTPELSGGSESERHLILVQR